MISSCLPFPCLTRRHRTVHNRPRRRYREREESLYNVPDFALRSHRTLPYAEAFLPLPPEPDFPLPNIPLPISADSFEDLPLVWYQSRPISPQLLPIQPPDLAQYRPRPIHPPLIADPPLRAIPYREPRPIPPPPPLLIRPPPLVVQRRPRAIPPPPLPIQPLRVIPYREPVPIPIPIPIPPPPVLIQPLRLPYPVSILNQINININACIHKMAGFQAGRNFIRGQDAQAIIDAVARQLLGTDYYNRDDDIRFGALRSLGGMGLTDDRRVEELMVDDLIRRYDHTPLSLFPLSLSIFSSLVSRSCRRG